MHRARLSAIWRDTKGATAIEYALIASLIAVIIVGAVGALGTEVETLWQSIVDGFNS